MTEKKQTLNKRKAKPSPTNAVTSNRLKLLITTVARKKADYFVDLIQSFDVNLQVLAPAEGTADANMLNILGLSDSSKMVIFSVIQEDKVPEALSALEHRFNTVRDGKGIAFTVPLTSVIGTLIFGFLTNNTKAVKEEKK